MNRFTFTAVFIVLLMTLSACNSTAVKLDEQSNGLSVDVKNGDNITIKLEGNPTTGYGWEVSEFDAAVVEVIGEPDFKSDSKMIGSGGVYTFTFKAVAPGSTKIKLIYHRSWEEDVEPVKVFEAILNVK